MALQVRGRQQLFADADGGAGSSSDGVVIARRPRATSMAKLTSNTTAQCLEWPDRSFGGQLPRYGRFLRTLFSSPRYVKAMASIVEATDADPLAQALVSLTMTFGGTLDVLEVLVESEFQRCHEFPATILRGNSLASKVASMYVKDVGREFLKEAVGSIVEPLALDDTLSLEVDPNRLARSHPEASEARITEMQEANQTLLFSIAVSFFERLTSDDVLSLIPHDILFIARIIGHCADMYLADGEAANSKSRLLGGFVMLRFINPALVAPESFGILSDPEASPSITARRNLLLLSKVLQNLSNGVVFGGKERHMTIMNPFIEERQKAMSDWLVSLASPVPATPTAAATTDPPFPDPSATEEPAPQPASFFGTVSPNTVIRNVHTLDVQALFALHNVVVNMLTPLVIYLTSVDTATQDTVSVKEKTAIEKQRSRLGTVMESEFDSIFDQMAAWDDILGEEGQDGSEAGAPDAAPTVEGDGGVASVGEGGDGPEQDGGHADEATRRASHIARVQLTEEEMRENARMDEDLFMAIDDLGPPPLLLPKNRGEVTYEGVANQQALGGGASSDLSTLEQARFFYGNAPNKAGQPVYYLLMCRLKRWHLEDVDRLAAFVRETMQRDIDSPYALVIDLSWMRWTFEMKRLAYKHLRAFASVFSRQQKKNCKAIYIVHPSTFVYRILTFATAFTSKKLRAKMKEIHQWEDILEFISPSNCLLPESSKNCTTKDFRVVKVNAKGKRQERLIKFTPSSLLNVDPRSMSIRNERAFRDLLSISAPRREPNIEIQFQAESGEPRTYICNTIDERNEVLAYFFALSFSAPFAEIDSSDFHVTKQRGDGGKKQSRIIKLTVDSVLTIHKGKIKREVGYSGIESCSVDINDSNVMWLRYKGDTEAYRIECSRASALAKSLLHAMSLSW